MFTVTANTEENRLYITVNAIEGRDWLNLLKDAVLKEILKLDIGFDCVSDLSNMRFDGDLLDEDIGILADIQTEMIKRGCFMAVTAGVGENSCRFNVLRNFYQIPQLVDMENAIAFLNDSRG